MKPNPSSPPTKVAVVMGTRPEAIKLAPVVCELRAFPQVFAPEVCVTAQHREMLDQVLDVFSIRPDFDLNLMAPGQTLAGFASRALCQLDLLFRAQRPRVVVVQGDTTTCFMAALAGFYHHAQVAHIEAGLRSFNRQAPFPEEVNRVLATHLADFHFAPTADARRNLLREGVAPNRIHVTGNTVVDAVQGIAGRLARRELVPPLAERFPALPRRFILVTAHRRENHGERLQGIFSALRQLSRRLPEIQFLFPVHPNPAVRQPAEAMLGGLPSIHLLPPVDYVSFVWLMQHSSLILSDSGGVQEEAPSLGKRVLVMRDVTERPEGIRDGFIKLAGTQPDQIVSAVMEALQAGPNVPAPAANPYGDGKAARRIVSVLKSVFDRPSSPSEEISEVYAHDC